MNPLNLLWIIPLSASVGAFIMAIFAGRKHEEDDHHSGMHPAYPAV